MRKFLSLVLVLAFFVTPKAALAEIAADSVKLGVLNVQRLINEAPEMATAAEELRNEFGEREEALRKEQEEFQALVADFQKEADAQSADWIANKEEELAEKQVVLQRKFQQYERDVSEKRDSLLKDFLNKVEEVVDKIAKDEHYSLIFQADKVVFVTADHDITDQVLSALPKD